MHKQARLRDELLSVKLDQNNIESDLMHQQRTKEHELEELKHQHFVVAQDRLNELIKEKTILRETFENSIIRLKDAHLRDMDDYNQRFNIEKQQFYQINDE